MLMLIFEIVLLFAAASANAEENVYRDLLLAEDYGDTITYVIGHKNPDSDAVGSAIAYAYLLNEIGIKAEAVISEPVNNETAYALNAFGIEPPPVLSNAEGKQFILVDHSAYSQAIDGMENARIVGIVDHHGIGDVTTDELINVRSAPIGATASLIFLAYQECDVTIPQDIARVMLMSILSDTRNLTSNVTRIDRTAFAVLSEIAAIEDIDGFYQKMSEELADYSGMTDMEIFYSDYKDYEAAGLRFGIADVIAFSDEAARQIAGRMHDVMEANFKNMDADMLFVMIHNNSSDENGNRMYMIAYGDGAADVLEKAFDNYDGKEFFVFTQTLSRKKDVAPAIADVLDSRH